MSSSCGCPTSRFTSMGPSLSFNLEEQHLGQGVQLQQADPHLESSVLTRPMSLVRKVCLTCLGLKPDNAKVEVKICDLILLDEKTMQGRGKNSKIAKTFRR